MSVLEILGAIFLGVIGIWAVAMVVAMLTALVAYVRLQRQLKKAFNKNLEAYGAAEVRSQMLKAVKEVATSERRNPLFGPTVKQNKEGDD